MAFKKQIFGLFIFVFFVSHYVNAHVCIDAPKYLNENLSEAQADAYCSGLPYTVRKDDPNCLLSACAFMNPRPLTCTSCDNGYARQTIIDPLGSRCSFDQCAPVASPGSGGGGGDSTPDYVDTDPCFITASGGCSQSSSSGSTITSSYMTSSGMVSVTLDCGDGRTSCTQSSAAASSTTSCDSEGNNCSTQTVVTSRNAAGQVTSRTTTNCSGSSCSEESAEDQSVLTYNPGAGVSAVSNRTNSETGFVVTACPHPPACTSEDPEAVTTENEFQDANGNPVPEANATQVRRSVTTNTSPNTSRTETTNHDITDFNNNNLNNPIPDANGNTVHVSQSTSLSNGGTQVVRYDCQTSCADASEASTDITLDLINEDGVTTDSCTTKENSTNCESCSDDSQEDAALSGSETCEFDTTRVTDTTTSGDISISDSVTIVDNGDGTFDVSVDHNEHDSSSGQSDSSSVDCTMNSSDPNATPPPPPTLEEVRSNCALNSTDENGDSNVNSFSNSSLNPGDPGDPNAAPPVPPTPPSASGFEAQVNTDGNGDPITDANGNVSVNVSLTGSSGNPINPGDPSSEFYVNCSNISVNLSDPNFNDPNNPVSSQNALQGELENGCGLSNANSAQLSSEEPGDNQGDTFSVESQLLSNGLGGVSVTNTFTETNADGSANTDTWVCEVNASDTSLQDVDLTDMTSITNESLGNLCNENTPGARLLNSSSGQFVGTSDHVFQNTTRTAIGDNGDEEAVSTEIEDRESGNTLVRNCNSVDVPQAQNNAPVPAPTECSGDDIDNESFSGTSSVDDGNGGTMDAQVDADISYGANGFADITYSISTTDPTTGDQISTTVVCEGVELDQNDTPLTFDENTVNVNMTDLTSICHAGSDEAVDVFTSVTSNLGHGQTLRTDTRTNPNDSTLNDISTILTEVDDSSGSRTTTTNNCTGMAQGETECLNPDHINQNVTQNLGDGSKSSSTQDLTVGIDGYNTLINSNQLTAPNGNIIGEDSTTCQGQDLALNTPCPDPRVGDPHQDPNVMRHSRTSSTVDGDGVATTDSTDFTRNEGGSNPPTFSVKNSTSTSDPATGDGTSLKSSCSNTEDPNSCTLGSPDLNSISGSSIDGDVDGDGSAGPVSDESQFDFQFNSDGTLRVTTGSTETNQNTGRITSQSMTCNGVSDTVPSVNNALLTPSALATQAQNLCPLSDAQTMTLSGETGSQNVDLGDTDGDPNSPDESFNGEVSVDANINSDGDWVFTSTFTDSETGERSTFQCVRTESQLIQLPSPLDPFTVCNGANGQLTSQTRITDLSNAVTQRVTQSQNILNPTNFDFVIRIEDDDRKAVHIIRCVNIATEADCRDDKNNIVSESYIGLDGNGSNENLGYELDFIYQSDGGVLMRDLHIDKNPVAQSTFEEARECSAESSLVTTIGIEKDGDPISSNTVSVILLENDKVDQICNDGELTKQYTVFSETLIDQSIRRTETTPIKDADDNDLYNVISSQTYPNGDTVIYKCLELTSVVPVCDASTNPTQVIRTVVTILPDGSTQTDMFDFTIGFNGGTDNSMIFSSIITGPGGEPISNALFRCTGMNITESFDCTDPDSSDVDFYHFSGVLPNGDLLEHDIERGEDGSLINDTVSVTTSDSNTITTNTVSTDGDGNQTITTQQTNLDNNGAFQDSSGAVCHVSAANAASITNITQPTGCADEDADETFSSTIVIGDEGEPELVTQTFNVDNSTDPPTSTPGPSWVCDPIFTRCTEDNASGQIAQATRTNAAGTQSQDVQYHCDPSVTTCNGDTATHFTVNSQDPAPADGHGATGSIILTCSLGIEICTAQNATTVDHIYTGKATTALKSNGIYEITQVDPSVTPSVDLTKIIKFTYNATTQKYEVFRVLKADLPDGTKHLTTFYCNSVSEMTSTSDPLVTCEANDLSVFKKVSSTVLHRVNDQLEVLTHHCVAPTNTGFGSPKTYCDDGAPVESYTLTIDQYGRHSMDWLLCFSSSQCEPGVDGNSRDEHLIINAQGEEFIEVNEVHIAPNTGTRTTSIFQCPSEDIPCTTANAISGSVSVCPSNGGSCVVSHIGSSNAPPPPPPPPSSTDTNEEPAPDVEITDLNGDDPNGFCVTMDNSESCGSNDGSGGFKIKQLVVADSHSCVLTTDSQAHCWGTNDNYQLGTDSRPVYQGKTCGETPAQGDTPLAAPNSTISFMNSFLSFADGYPGYEGVCDDNVGSTTKKGFPSVYSQNIKSSGGSAVPIALSVTGHLSGSISSINEYHGQSLLASTLIAYGGGVGKPLRVSGFGDNTFGSSAFEKYLVFSKRSVFQGRKIVQISSSTGFACMMDNFGEVYCYGSSGSGQRGYGNLKNSNDMPTRWDQTIPGVGSHYVNYSIQYPQVGWNNYFSRHGQTTGVGSGGVGTFFKAVKLTTAGSDISNIGAPAACAVSRYIPDTDDNTERAHNGNGSGDIYCWGSNKYNIFKQDDTPSNPRPTKYTRPTKALETGFGFHATDVSYNGYHICALVIEGEVAEPNDNFGTGIGRVHCWGNNISQSYSSTSSKSYTNEDNDIAIIEHPNKDNGVSFKNKRLYRPTSNHIMTAGNLHSSYTCAIDTESNVYCWGSELAQGEDDKLYSQSFKEPQRVIELDGASSISGSTNQICAVVNNGGRIKCVERRKIFQ